MMLGPRMQPEEESSQPARSGGRRWPGFLEAGLIAGAVLFALEQLLLGTPAPGLSWVIATLFLSLGLFVGATIAAQEALIQRLGLGGWGAAGVRATGSLFVSFPTATTLFDGAFASTLPGASSAHLWVPLLGITTLAAVVRFGLPWLTRAPRRRQMAGLVLLAIVIGLELVNRNVKPDELPGLHTALICLSVVGIVLALRCLLPAPLPRSRRTNRLRAGAAAVLLLSTIASLRYGLQDPEDRWVITTKGTHARLLVRAARLALDFDGDGHAAVLGGADCDDSDPARHPEAPEIPGNDVDENCDGFAPAGAPKLNEQQAAVTADLKTWSNSDSARAFVEQTKQLDLVLISVDALRADVVAPTEQNRAAFPNLLGFLDRSIRFDRAFAPAAGTDLSMSSILTGRIDPFSTVERTLAEAMQQSGRRTHAIIPREVLRYAGRKLLTRGLESFDRMINDRFEQDVGSYSTGTRTTELALRWLADQPPQEPVYLWVHYFDVHEHDQIEARHLRKALGRKIETREDRYRATVALVDRALAELLAGLEAQGRLQRSIVILVSDHGEGLGEDPRLPENHGLYVYNPLVHVPLAFSLPGADPGVVKTPISLIDLAPTLAHLAGTELPGTDGVTLAPHLVADAPAELREASRPIVLNESDQHGLVQWPYKVMQRPADNLTELYDLSADFAEQNDLSEAEPERVEELLSLYYAHPYVTLDRTRKGRRARERAAQTPPED
jgi:arylsulfatase A-like enzyme